jgi:hypothetical protein
VSHLQGSAVQDKGITILQGTTAGIVSLPVDESSRKFNIKHGYFFPDSYVTNEKKTSGERKVETEQLSYK